MSSLESAKPTVFKYHFKTKEQKEHTFEVVLDAHTHNVIHDSALKAGNFQKPEWAKLDHHKCTNCPYNSDSTPYCPVALNISHIVDTFQNDLSYHVVEVSVESHERQYNKKTDLQTALQSLLGLVMAASDCQHMNFLKGLVKTHLPFSNLHETTIRIFGYYLQQSLKDKDQSSFSIKAHADILSNRYRQLAILNKFMMKRIQSIQTKGECIQNAIIILNGYAALIPLENLIDLD